jgi:peptidoglycan/LPS O-acetylase OafA/YrhL
MGTEADRHPQLDGLRAIAMCGVLYVHLFDKSPTTEHLRVSLFFVISGFLITHVLLLAKDSGQTLNIGSFYIRRALRLFPALIVLVLVASALDMDGFRASALWHAGQMSNIYFVISDPEWTWSPWVAAQLWSLNVVEQFYLAAPFLVLFLNRQRLLVVAACIWIAAVFIRVNAAHMGALSRFVWTVFCYDPIFAGVMARLLLFDARIAAAAKSGKGTLLAVVVMASPLMLWAEFGHAESYRILIQPALALIVMQAFLGFGGPVGAMLGSGPAQFMARISYGVFVYHLAIYWTFLKIYPDVFDRGLTTLLVVSVMAIIVATASFQLIEKPIAGLKRRFPIAASRPPVIQP